MVHSAYESEADAHAGLPAILRQLHERYFAREEGATEALQIAEAEYVMANALLSGLRESARVAGVVL